jgi:phospholipid/cholesterol/gamma-HCH transport system substrate-binding protein
MISSKAVGAGAFVFVGVLLFTVALFMIGERRSLFSRRFPVYTEFARVGQLEIGASVRISGLDAGEVEDIEVPREPSGKFRVRMLVRNDLHRLVRTDSVATTDTEGLVGAEFVNITGGTDRAPLVPENGTIPSREPLQISDLLQQASETVALINETVMSLRGDAETAVHEVALTAEDTHALVQNLAPDLTTMARNGVQISADTQQIVASINDGKGTIGKLINDDTLYNRANETMAQAQDTMTNFREVSDEARRAIADLRSPDGPAMGLLADMRNTVSQAHEAASDLADDLEALKHNFLFRGFFKDRGYFDLDTISPAEYRDGLLENGDRKALRIWLGADRLFERGPNGTEVLTDEGRARLDSAMSTYLEYVPTNPIVVEGYATEGLEGERFRRGRARAATVREYLVARYGLSPQHTGYIALDTAEGSPSGKRWDGVAITLFLDRDALQFARQATP